MADTKIQWADKVWNPVTGCTKVSAGCQNCYAESIAFRLQRMGVDKYKNGFTAIEHPGALNEPLKWKKPCTVFVPSMGDMFHEHISQDFKARIWDTMFDCPQHTFIILTKRPEIVPVFEHYMQSYHRDVWYDNIILGVSVEDQKTADERIPILLDIPAKTRIVSFEPALSHINIEPYLPYLNQIIVGGESGKKARPMYPGIPLIMRNQCIDSNTAFYFKQWGEWKPAKPPLPNGFTIFDHNKVIEWHCGYEGAEYDRFSIKVGKKKAGNLLDGRVWNQMVEVK